MAQASAGFNPIIDSQGEQVNPTNSTVLADTGALPGGGIYEVRVLTSTTVAARPTIQHRNAANTANVDDVQEWFLPDGTTVGFVFRFAAQANERFRILLGTGITGTAVANITAYRIA